MKKIIAILGCIALLSSLAACDVRKGNSEGVSEKQMAADSSGGFPTHEPYGVGIGAMPGRVDLCDIGRR